MKGRAAVVLVLCTLGMLLWPSLARAHMGSTKYAWVQRTAEGVDVLLDIEAVDVAAELEVDPDTVTGHPQRVDAWLGAAIRVSAAGLACGGSSSDLQPHRRHGRRYLSVRLHYACDDPAGEVQLRDDAVFDEDPLHEAVIRVVTPEGADVHVLRTGDRTITLAGHPRAARQFGRFVVQGGLHLLLGYDHLLFLLALLLVAGVRARDDGLRPALRSVAVVVTGFTLGHSVTLIAAALDVVVLPTGAVEAAIALSIVVVAGANLAGLRSGDGLPLAAVAFGLVHGFGFSNVLHDLALPPSQRILGLLGFNLGIEVGQLLFLVIVLGPLAWAATQRWYDAAVLRGGSIIIGGIGLYWFVVRALSC